MHNNLSDELSSTGRPSNSTPFISWATAHCACAIQGER
jgi:hypothetical protein